MENLQGKKVLIFTSVLFNYHTQIKNSIEESGAEVHLYDERNNPSSVEKILIRKARFFVSNRTNAYYRQVTEKERTFNPDYILFVSPEAVTGESLRILRNAFKTSIFILYLWDSVKNKHIDGILKFFDRKLSFDPEDCKKFNMIFRPLFFSPDFDGEACVQKKQYDYDVSFIGTVHSDRAKILLAIKEFCDKQDLKYYFYLFIPGKLLYSLRMLTDKYLRKWDKSFIHLDSIEKEEVSRISSETRCIIDINHPYQTGLTMRTIEMIGLNRKIATTNKNITAYDFYRPENQIVLDRKNLVIRKDMIREDYSPIPDEIHRRYSVQYWVKEVFDLER